MNKVMVFILPALKGGGAEKFVLNLYKAMERYQGYECHIISIRNQVEHDISGYRVHFAEDFCNISKKGFKRLTYRKNIAKEIDRYIKENIDNDPIVLSNMMMADKVMSTSQLRVYHVIHSSYSKAFLISNNLIKNLKTKLNINKTYANHPLVFVSQAAKENFFLSFNTKQNTYVIYNPIETDDVKKLSSIPLNMNGEDYLIHIGRFNRAKRHDRLIDAFSMVKDKNIKLMLLGVGELKASVIEQVNLLNLQSRVIFHGFEKNPYPYLKNAKGLILTSDYEGLPTVLIEAALLNTPIVTTLCTDSVFEILGHKAKVVSPKNDINLLSYQIDEMIKKPSAYTYDLDDKFTSFEVSQCYHQLNNIS